ncbi:chitin elicitor receptor kinase [Ranunculus cassubicifolius]
MAFLIIRRSKLGLFITTILLVISTTAESRCNTVCNTALASYYIWSEPGIDLNLTFISTLFNIQDSSTIPPFNSNATVPNKDTIYVGTRVNIPIPCGCINNDFLGHVFTYTVQSGDTYGKVANQWYANLTTADVLQRSNPRYPPENIPDTNAFLNVTINCYCGDQTVSKDYGLFVTYPMRPGDTLSSIATTFDLSQDIVRRYNPDVNFGRGTGLVYIPGKDQSGRYPALTSRGKSTGAIAGISVGVIVAVLLVAVCVYIGIFRKKKKNKQSSLLRSTYDDNSNQHGRGTEIPLNKIMVPADASPGLTGISVDKSVEFSYEELSQATSDFSLANKIGQGGFGAVYYAELRGEKAAIKKMDMQASKEFLAELKVLTHVHHLNLVRLIGYCVEGSLFLVYEFIENGNLSEHLRGTGREPLPWPTRVQIALDSARGLEYIHEHTVPVYIHRDIKSANILIDTNYHGKVADFGLAKLTEVGSSLQTRLVGTFGYMPPEYAQYGDVSPKVDVYAFGVVLYELISAKEAIVKLDNADTKGLVAMFEDALSHPDPRDDLAKLVDTRLGENYPFDSVRKLAQLARACTHENPQLRPSMRSIVVALMTLSSSTEDWDVRSFFENQALMNLMSGR